jgi:hypothetical protein
MKLYSLLILIGALSFGQGKIEKIDFVGLKKTKESFLKKIVLSREQEVLDSIKLDSDVTLMNRLNGVSKSTFLVSKLENGNFNVTYTIIENFSLIPSLQIWTNNEVAAYRLGIYEYNLLGRNITLGGFYQYNNFSSFGVNLSAPQLFSAKWGMDFNLQRISTFEPLFFNGGKANYQYINTALEVLGSYQFDFKNRVKLGINLFEEKYIYKDGLTAPEIPQNLDQDKVLFKSQYIYDDLDYNFYKVKGFKSVFFGQYVFNSSAYQNNFLIAWNDFLYYKHIGSRGNWATRLRFGLSSNDDSPFAPFSLDNNLNLRGVGNIVDRGTGTLVLNTEYRHTIYEKKWFVLQSNVFVDTGSWRKPGGELTDFFESKNLRMFPGVGLRFIHKTIFNAVLRIDYGWGINENGTKGLVFGVGQYF